MPSGVPFFLCSGANDGSCELPPSFFSLSVAVNWTTRRRRGCVRVHHRELDRRYLNLHHPPCPSHLAPPSSRDPLHESIAFQSMANPWGIAASGWCFVVMGWLMSPILSFLVNKFFASLTVDTSRKLRELEIDVIPSMKPMLVNLEKQRTERPAKHSGSDLKTLEKIENDLKNAMYEAEDILDLVEYHRIERKVKGHCSSVQHLFSAAGACITRCKGSWFVTRAEIIIRDALLQCAKGWAWLSATLCRSGDLLPIFRRASNPLVQRIRAWLQSLDIKPLCRSMQARLAKTYVAACYYRDWSYEVIGIKTNQKDDIAADSFFPASYGKSMKKRIEHIENIVNDSKKSHLLSKDRSSSEILVKGTNEESTSTQEEIDAWHGSIKREVFGRDKERQDICSMLRKGFSSRKPYSVIGIHGITGSGKSTLAQYVCDHEKEAEDKHFDLIMFSHVSTTFRVDKIFRDMLGQTTEETEDLRSLRKKLEEKLKEKRFLLVLDDLWVNKENEKGRDILLDALDAGKSGSIILVTAQSENAARDLGAQKQILIPELKEEDYLSLFMHHARPVGDDGALERIGTRIANKLLRSPIAAVTVGKQLRNRSKDFWLRTANDDVLNETMGALWWSFQQLGQDIRHCFAYCSIFPRGYKLQRDQLVRIWIAQGFVNTRSDVTEELEDVGQKYFDELLMFSFLQVERTFLATEKFTIHDLLHELAERVAGSYFRRIDLLGSPKDIPLGVRHVFIQTNNGAEIAEKYLELENLRTLIIKKCYYYADKDRNRPIEGNKRKHNLEKVFERLFTRLRKLRVLIVEGLISNDVRLPFSFPASIDQMRHLRYLGFRYEGDVVLLSTFSKLYHMQTIEVLPYDCRVSCPGDMSNLVHLQNISGFSFFPNVGSLTSLQTMKYFEVKKEQGYELKQLKHLNKLRGTLKIRCLGNVESKEEALEADLARKERLTKLELDFTGEPTSDPDVQAEVLEGLWPPKDIIDLCIFRYKGSRYPSWMLSGQHPDALKRVHKLELWGCSRLASIPEDSGLFINLLVLCIFNCDWDSLPENMERLVSLQHLSIRRCRKMEFLPTLPQSIEKIEIFRCGMLSITCQQDGHENWHKIRHIKEKFFWPLEGLLWYPVPLIKNE